MKRNVQMTDIDKITKEQATAKCLVQKVRALLSLSFLLLMLCLGVREAWGQGTPSGTDYSGTY